MIRKIIKKVINEEVSSKLRRRISKLNELITYTLPYAYPCDYENFEHFIEGIYYELDLIDIEWVDSSEIKKYIENYFLDELIDHYNDNCSKSNLQENTSRIKRRLQIIDHLVKYSIKNFYDSEKICELYENSEEFLSVLIEAVIHRMYYDYFGDISDESEDWSEIYNFIEKYIKNKHGYNIMEYYYKKCAK